MSRDTGLQKKYKKQLGTCREYAVLNLAFSVFDLFEDNENAFHMDEIRSLLTLLTDDESNNEEVLQKCADLRKSITEFTNRLVIYRERFRIYSDVLDRMTVKTGESAKTVSYDLDQEAALADQIVFSLARYQDTARRNFELLKCMNLLPIRMTKERFFDEIKAAAAYYLDGKKVDFDEYIEKIRMSGLLCQNDSGRNEWKRYEDEWERFLRFSEELNNNSETAGSLWKEADSYLNELEESIDLQSMLQDITNLTYTIAITRKYPGEPQKVYWDSMEIIRRVLDGTKNENEFIPLEGKIEKVFEEFRKIDGSVSEPHDSEEQNAGDDPAMELKNDIRTILLLNSGSSFADIEKQESHELADQKYLTETIEKLMEDFKRQFSGFPKKFRWSIMRNVMNELPLPFENVNELQQYILSSLVQCKDKTEKRWVFEKIQLWMDEMGTYL